jgi:hypothetical protein
MKSRNVCRIRFSETQKKAVVQHPRLLPVPYLSSAAISIHKTVHLLQCRKGASSSTLFQRTDVNLALNVVLYCEKVIARTASDFLD